MKDINVPAGYKSTDVGVIPEDWKENYLTELGILERGKSKHRPRWAEHLYGGNYPFIQTGEVTAANKYILKYNKTYSEAGLAQSKLWEKDTLCITIAANIAETAILNFPACFPDSILGFSHNSKKANVGFIFYTVNYLQKHIKELAVSSAQDNINLGTFQKLKLPLPPLPEQKAIARVLSDVDELIRECDSLLAKKRDIKQGTMQQLLTGKQRLPGFSGKWEEKKLKDICWFQEGPGLRQWQFTKEGMKVINVTNLENGYLNLDRTDRHISIEEFTKMYQHFEIDSGDIVVASSGNSYGKTSVVRTQDLPLMMNTSVIRFKPLKKLAYKFLLSFLRSNIFKNQIDLLITGGAQPNFGPVHLDKIVILLPLTLPEQKAIAEILSDMDAEIEALEKKRDKYKAIKQGMMQELLTGKTRLTN